MAGTQQKPCTRRWEHKSALLK